MYNLCRGSLTKSRRSLDVYDSSDFEFEDQEDDNNEKKENHPGGNNETQSNVTAPKPLPPILPLPPPPSSTTVDNKLKFSRHIVISNFNVISSVEEANELAINLVDMLAKYGKCMYVYYLY